MIFDLLTPPQGPQGGGPKKHQDKTSKNLAEVDKYVAIFPVTTLFPLISLHLVLQTLMQNCSNLTYYSFALNNISDILKFQM